MRARFAALPVSMALTVAVGASCGHDPAPDAAAIAIDAGADAQGEADAGSTDASFDGGDAGDGGDSGDAGVVDRGPLLPSFAEEPFPPKATSFPKNDEWATAPLVAIDRAYPETLFATHAADKGRCTARRVREWVRIHCAHLEGGALLLGGNLGGLSIRFDKVNHGTEVIIPVRPGDRRVIEMLGTETLTFKAFSGDRAIFGFVLSEQWPAGDDRPTIVAR